MRIVKHRHRKPQRAAGFTLLEAVFALFLLAVCLVPAANALRGAVQAPVVGASAARNLDCVSALMETVLAQPYASLLSLSYDVPDDPNCPARQVTISRYGNKNTRTIGPVGNCAAGICDDLLLVSVGLSDPADGNPFTLTTLVAR